MLKRRLKKYRIVYRVQLRTDKHVGPYRYWVDEECTPEQRRRLMHRPNISAERPVTDMFYFGFMNKAALLKWFTKRDIDMLRHAGYVIAKYKVHTDLVIQDQRRKPTQCAFMIDHAELLEAA